MHNAHLVQLWISYVVEATQKTGALRVAASSLAQLIALQARHDWRFALAAVGLTTASNPVNERQVWVTYTLTHGAAVE